MFEAHGRAAWAQTSAVLTLLANIHRDPQRHGPFSPADFNPYARRKNTQPIPKTKDLSILKLVFVDNLKGGRR